MLYHLLYSFHEELSFLNVLRYLTFRTIYASVTSLVVCLVMGPWLIRRLTRYRVGLATIDQPRHAGSLGSIERDTGPVAYYRFHGRNFGAWFAEGRPSHERYDYLYSTEELEPYASRIRERATDARARAIVVITNNHYQGQAAVNALQLKSWMSGHPVPAPEPLVARYPRDLAGVAEAADDPGPLSEQSDLFGGARDPAPPRFKRDSH